MCKKLIVSCVALVALTASAGAPLTSASPVLTREGTAVPVGTSITVANTGNFIFGGIFNIGCVQVDLKGFITLNSGTKFKYEVPAGSASFTGTGAGGDCTSALGDTKMTLNSKLCMESVTGTDSVSVTGCGANITFSEEVTGTGACKYSTASLTASFQTSWDFTFQFGEQVVKKEEGGIFCPNEGRISLHVDISSTGATLFVS